MNRSSTVQDVASLAGVSVATVSRVLNGNAAVSDELRATVEKAIKELDYKPRSSSPATRRNAGRIALVISDITNPYFPSAIRGVSAECALDEFELLLYNCDRNPDTEKRIYHQILSHGVSGLIVIPFSERTPQQVNSFVDEGFPTVFMDRTIPRAVSYTHLRAHET